MKKMRVVSVMLMLVLIVSTALLAACAPEAKETKYKVEFMNGDTVLRTVDVVEGNTVDEWNDPAVVGKVFMGWFATATLTHDFKFDTVIKKDTKIFGGFVAYQADTRDFFIVGSGLSPNLKLSNWGNGTNTKLTTAHTDKVNKFTITTDLYQDDQFQFAINSEWHSKRGFGYVDGATTDFASGAGLGDASPKGANIKVVKDGNYTLTLTTYPAEDYYAPDMGGYTEAAKESYKHNNYDSITIIRNGELLSEKPAAFSVYYIKGQDITNWQDVYSSDAKMKKGEDGNDHIHTFNRYLKEDDAFMFTSRTVLEGKESIGAGTDYIKKQQIEEGQTVIVGAERGDNIIAKVTGIFTFTYNETTKKLTAVCNELGVLVDGDIYIAGLEAKADGSEGVDWSILNSTKKFAKQADSNIYELGTLTLKEGDQIKVQIVTKGAEKVVWGGDNNTNISAYAYQSIGKTVASGDMENANADFLPADLTGEWPNYNIKATKAGTYRVTYDAYSNLINFYIIAG